MNALNAFEKNRSALLQDEQAMRAWRQLTELSQSETPYKQLNQVSNWIAQVQTVNDRLLSDKRKAAVEALDLKINQLLHEIQKSGLETNHLSNQLLSPLQNLKNEILQETGLGNLHVLQTQRMEDLFDEALAQLEHRIAIHNTQNLRLQRQQSLLLHQLNPKPVLSVLRHHHNQNKWWRYKWEAYTPKPSTVFIWKTKQVLNDSFGL